MDADMIKVAISKDLLAQLPTAVYPGSVVVVDTAAQADEVINLLNVHTIVGFDTETKPSFRKGHNNKVALIQVATDSCCYLFRINKFGLTPKLIEFIENPSVTKVGLSLKDDFHVLQRNNGEFHPASFVDLQAIVKQFSIADCSLQKIYGILFGSRISKGQRLSNWEADRLSTSQQAYAAMDAWSCLQIYQHLRSGAFVPEQSLYVTEVVADTAE